MKPELILGTAQFGLDYGITNLNGKIKFNAVCSILKKAYSYKIKRLDTAQSYGDAEKVIGQAKPDNLVFNISSKLVPIEKNSNLSDPKDFWFRYLKNSLKNLNTKKLDSLIVHRADDLLGEHKEKLLKWLLLIKERNNSVFSVFTINAHGLKLCFF